MHEEVNQDQNEWRHINLQGWKQLPRVEISKEKEDGKHAKNRPEKNTYGALKHFEYKQPKRQ